MAAKRVCACNARNPPKQWPIKLPAAKGAVCSTIPTAPPLKSSAMGRDGGTSWRALNITMPSSCVSFSCFNRRPYLDAVDANTIYFLNTVSRDGEASFGPATGLLLAEDANGTLYGESLTGDTLMPSFDRGQSWERLVTVPSGTYLQPLGSILFPMLSRRSCNIRSFPSLAAMEGLHGRKRRR